MRIGHTCIGAVLLFAATATGCAGTSSGGLRPGQGEFSSDYVDITLGGMIALPGEGPALALQLQNKTQGALFVSVAFEAPDPAQRCESTKTLAAGESHMYKCPQSSLAVDQDYPVHIAVYGDETRSELLESPRTKFRFGEQDAAAFQALVDSLTP